MDRSDVASFLRSRIFVIILIGLLARYVLAPILTYGFDVTGWALGIENILAGNGLYDVDGYYYTPVWGYVMGFMAAFQDLFLNICSFGGVTPGAFPVEHMGWYYTADLTTVSFNIFVKSAFFAFDLVVGYLIYWFVYDRTEDRRKAELGFGVWFLCPVVIIVGAVGGMFDALVALCLMLTLVFVKRDRLFLAGVFFALAVYLKLFPAFLLFPLVAYVLLRHREDKVRALGMSVLGALVVTAVVFGPQILAGHTADTFGFITSRFTHGIGSGMSSSLEGIGTAIGYLAILAVSVLVSWHYYRSSDTGDGGRALEMFALVACVVFLYPSAPQYILMLLPFVAILIALGYSQIRWPALLLSVASAVFVLAHNAVLLLSFAEFGDLFSVDWVMNAVYWFQDSSGGVSVREVTYYGAGVVQWIALLWMALVLSKTFLKRIGPVPAEMSVFAEVRSIGKRFLRGVRKGTMLQRELLLMVPFTLVAVGLYAVVQLTGMPSSVVDGYFPYADAMFHGVFPYTEKVFVYGDWNVWEYPPLAYVFILLPRLIGSNPATYQAVYLVMVLFFVWLGMRSAGRIAEHFGFDHLKTVTVYTITMLLMAEFVFDRYDVIPMVITLLALQFFVERRYAPASAMVALGVLVKLYPLVLLPIFLIWLLRRRAFRGLGVAVVSFLLVCCLAIPFLLIGDVSQFLGYHSDRPLEVESLFASILEAYALQAPGTGMHVVYSYGSDNIVGGLADTVSGFTTYVMLASVLVMCAFYLYVSRSDERNPLVFNAMFLVLAAFILFNSVFSAQYIIWLIPFIMLFLMTDDSGRGKGAWVLFILLEVFTQLNFLFNFGMRADGEFLSYAGVAILLIRNSALLVMIASTMKGVWRARTV